MSGSCRRALLASALALPTLPLAGWAVARSEPRRMRVSIPLERLTDFLPILRAFTASQPDLFFETLVRDDDNSLAVSEIREAVQARRPYPDAALADAGSVAWGTERGAWRRLPASLREAGAASGGHLAQLMQPLTGEEAMLVSPDPGGPVLLHRASVLPDPPRSAAALLDYARQNPRRFLYPRPSESALGRQFLMALPHLLRDSDPSDPQLGWTRSWAWLKEVDSFIDYYPSDDAAAFEEFATDGIALMPASLTAYLRGRKDALLPDEASFALFEGAPLIPQGVFLVMPRDATEESLALVETFARFLLRPEIQSGAFGRGFLPGFAVNQPAPRTEAERSAWNRILPAEMAARVAAAPLAPPLGPQQLALMLRRWDEEIAARHGGRR
ncbi:extracellular solute-binding protein [Roseococcus sp.]|uniref:extracellular solute-binding protein n=1 Tax=Roseococcus sp. TaxID=2109646 RepID=UPI003BA9A739